MTEQQPTGRISNSAKGAGHLWCGLLLILILACGKQTAEIESPRPGQSPKQTQVKGYNQQTTPQPVKQRFPYAPDQVLVKFSPETEDEAIMRIQQELKLQTVRKYSSPNLFLMRITDGAAVTATIERLEGYENVEYAEPNYGVKATQ